MQGTGPTMHAWIDRDELRHWVRRTLTALSQTGALPTLPGVGGAVVALAREPHVPVADVARVIGTDVGLATRVLRLASAGGDPVATLPAAIEAIGARKTCDFLLTSSTRQLFGPADAQVQALWNHALATALAAEELVRVTGRVAAGTVFLPGLLHDVGRIAFLIADAMSFDVITHLVAAGQGDALDLEREWYGFTHAEAGAVLVEDWGLLPEQCDAIRWHHHPTEAGPGRELAEVLDAADRLAYAAGFRGGPIRPGSPAPAQVGLSAADAAACAARVQQAFAAQSAALA